MLQITRLIQESNFGEEILIRSLRRANDVHFGINRVTRQLFELVFNFEYVCPARW